MEIGNPLSLGIVRKEFLLQLKLLNKRGQSRSPLVLLVSLALDELKMCELPRKRSRIYLERFATSWHSSIFSNVKSHQRTAVIVESIYRLFLTRTPLKLFYLMRLWHQEVFQHFTCVRTLVFRYGAFFLNKNRLAQLIAQYEESNPSGYLNQICVSLESVFLYYVLSHRLKKSSHTEYEIFYYKFPNFLRERMGWTDNQLPTDDGSWPLDFIIKFSLGLYRHYDYLKVFNAGLEPKTYIGPFSDTLINAENLGFSSTIEQIERYINFNVFIETLKS